MKGFVFGKFLPFHNGHLAMLRFALKQCDHLTVIVCASDKEIIPGETRCKWILESVANDPDISCITCNYDEDELPNTSVPSQHASSLWAWKFRELIPGAEVLITSEDYGPMVATHMQIAHCCFDQARAHVSASGTMIRNDLFAHWKLIPPAVQRYFALKVAVLGTESTGKTTLVKHLADWYGCTAIMEAGRDIIAHSSDFTYADLEQTVIEHASRIRNADVSQHPLIVIDTDVRISQSYCRMFLHRQLAPERDIMEANACDTYFYMRNDVPFVQDGTRLTETLRNELDLSHRMILHEAGIAAVELSGTWQDKTEKARGVVDELMRNRKAARWRTDE